MKRTWLTGVLLTCAMTGASFAGVPSTMTYQGVLASPSGAVVPDGTYWVRFRLYTAATGDTSAALWRESVQVQTVKGIFTAVLGNSTSLATVPFDAPYWLGLSVAGGAELAPRITLTASPYSLNSRGVGGTITGVTAGSGLSGGGTTGVVTLGIGTGAVTGAMIQDATLTGAKVQDGAIGTTQIGPDIISSINGVSNDGGNVALVGGTNVTVVPDAGAKTITINASPGGGGTISNVVAGAGLSGGGTSSTVQLDVSAGTGISVGAGGVSLNTTYTDGLYVNELQASSITSGMLQSGSVVSGKIGASAVGSTELQDNIDIGSASAGGWLRTYYNGGAVTLLSPNVNNDGYIGVNASSGTNAARLSTLSDHSGFVGVYRASDGKLTAYIYGPSGAVYATAYNSYTPDPFDPNRSVQYSALGGAEAAVYLRGKARVIGGRGHVSFPDYFSGMTVASSVTVSLTPRSLDSKGLAVMNADNAGMDVGELAGGTGSYEFDYVVYGVRKGFEDYQVYVKNSDIQSTSGGPAPER